MTQITHNTKTDIMAAKPRISWVDVVKGMSIFLVVMMHSTLGVQIALDETSWMGAIVEFARPFRIPCFMLISGLFLHRSINSQWPRYLDRKILHFVYFYVLWVSIQFIIKAPAWMAEGQSLMDVVEVYLMAFVQPFGTLWFIYLLPVFYLVTRALRKFDWKWVLAAGIILQILPIHTGSVIIDEFASRYVYFLIGFFFYEQLFLWADYAGKNSGIAILFVGSWILINIILISNLPPQFLQDLAYPTGAGSIVKMADMPIISLGLGIAGSVGMIALGAMIIRIKRLAFMGWVGEHSIVVYLAFFLPMAVSRIILVRFASQYLTTGVIAAIVTLTAAIGPLVFYWLVKKSGAGMFLFERPTFARLKENPELSVNKKLPAE